MTKGHLDKDVVRQLFFFLVVCRRGVKQQLTDSVFQLFGLLTDGDRIRGLLDRQGSAR